MTDRSSKPLTKKYVPHLASLLAMGEHNYMKLMRLLPEVDDDAMRYRFVINDALKYEMVITDVARYTTTLSISQQSVNMPKFLKPEMIVRMYHDARSAEVLSVQNIGQIQPSYEYPNLKMHQKNEKFLVNVFLAEWLVFCESNQKVIAEGK